MRSLLLPILALALSACATLPEEVRELRKGITKYQVKEHLGEPSGFSTLDGGKGEVWVYTRKFDACALSIDAKGFYRDASCRHDGAAEEIARQAAIAEMQRNLRESNRTLSCTRSNLSLNDSYDCKDN